MDSQDWEIYNIIYHLQGYFNSLRSEKVGTGIAITILCPGPVFSDLLKSASTEKAGEVFYMIFTDSWFSISTQCAPVMRQETKHLKTFSQWMMAWNLQINGWQQRDVPIYLL